MTFFDTITKWRWRQRVDKKKESEGEKQKPVQRSVLGMPQSALRREVKKILPQRFLTGVLRAHHLTEKTAAGEKNNSYVFIINKCANAREVRSAVESRYSVSVVNVRMVTMPGKERRRGTRIGWKPGFKKAIVEVKKGERIEV